jgi:acetyl esterase/lipase
MLAILSSRTFAALLVVGCMLASLASAQEPAANAPAADAKLPEPKPIQKGDQVLTLYPPGHPALKHLSGYDQPEEFHFSKGRFQNITNVHNPSIELQLPPPEQANGTAIILAPGGGNKALWADMEGIEVGKWLNSLGVAAFVERYRLNPYDSAVDALSDTQRAIRMVRANAEQWHVDPHKIGVMGFSAGGEQAARVALNFDDGKPNSPDRIERESCRPDFVVLVYAGWKTLDLNHVPKNAPPAFCVCAGVGDADHAAKSVDFFDAYLKAHTPAELHIYASGKHGGGIGARSGIPFGSWPERFVDWTVDMRILPQQPSARTK